MIFGSRLLNNGLHGYQTVHSTVTGVRDGVAVRRNDKHVGPDMTLRDLR